MTVFLKMNIKECLNKAGAVVEAIKMADGGIDYDSTH